MRNRYVRYYYIGGNSLHSGQYIALLKSLEKKGIIVNLILPYYVRYNSFFKLILKPKNIKIGPNSIENLKINFNGEIHIIPFLVGCSYFGKFLFLIFLTILLIVKGNLKSIIVIHSKLTAEYALFLKKIFGTRRIKVISEIEGDAKSEFEYEVLNKYKRTFNKKDYFLIKNICYRQYKIIKESDIVLCVTKKLIDLFYERYCIYKKDKFHVFPSMASSNYFYFNKHKRELTRKILKIENYFTVVYCGNLKYSWQMPEKLVETFKIIKNYKEKSIFIIITPKVQEKYILKYLIKYNIINYFFVEVPHIKIVDFLCAADCALIVRERNIMNEVSTPGKFAEYALSGLPIIMTDGIGQYSKIMKRKNYALILEDIHNYKINKLKIAHFLKKQLPNINRMEYSYWAKKNFSIENKITNLINIYNKIGK